MTRPRAGAGLAELFVALLLAVLLAAAAGAALVGAERYTRRVTTESEDHRALREAELVLSAELRAALADSIRQRGDTAIEFLGLVGTAVVCSTADSVLVFPPAVMGVGTPYAVWRTAPEAGDIVVAFDSTAAGAWQTAIVDSAVQRAGGSGCVPASGLLTAADSAAGFPALRIRLAGALPGRVAVGAPARVVRRGRYVLLKSSTGEWTLSYRRCATAGVCGTSQPVAGPLASARDSGLTFELQAAASQLDVSLRAPVRVPPGPRDSRRLLIVLRNRATPLP